MDCSHVAALIEHGRLCDLCNLLGSPDDPLSLDRIIHSDPYSIPNIRPAHSGCNFFRDGLTDAEMYEMVYQVYEHLRVVLGHGVPITAEAAHAALTATLVPIEDVPAVPLTQSDLPHLTAEMEAIPLGEDPLEWKVARSFSDVGAISLQLLERAPLSWWLVTIPMNCYLRDAESRPLPLGLHRPRRPRRRRRYLRPPQRPPLLQQM